MQKPIAILILTAALSAQAATQDEVALSCDLEKAKAELSASVLEMPYAYGSVSNNPTDKGVTAGIGYSFIGRSKAKLMRDAADARCTALAATMELDEQQRWLLVAIAKVGARAELEGLLEARKRAAEQTIQLQAQLNAKTVTIAEYNTVRQAALGIEARINQLRLTLADPSTVSSTKTIKSLLEVAKTSTVKAAELEAKVSAESAWDVSVVAGGRKEISSWNPSSGNDGSGKPTTPFVGITFRWSFGAGAADKAVGTVKDRTERLFVAATSGYVQSADRLLLQVTDALKVERDREAQLQTSLREAESVIGTFKPLDTALALNTRRSLELQAAIQQAELSGVRRRITEYQNFMAKL